MLSVSNDFKNAIKKLDVYSDGKVSITNSSETLNFTRDDIVKIDVFGSAFSNNKVLGNLAQHSLTLELLGDLTSSISLDKENIVKVDIGVLVSGVYEYVRLQDFIIVEISYNDTTNITKISATDYLVKLNKEFLDTNTYPKTLKSYLESVLTYCGLELENTTFFNDTFSVTSKPFQDYENCKEIVRQIAELALCYVVINKVTNKVELKNAFYVAPTTEPYTHAEMSSYTHADLNEFTHLTLGGSYITEESIVKDYYWNLKFKDHMFGTLGLNTLTLKISQVDGENNSVNNAPNVAIDGSIEVAIVDNQFINTEAKRLSVIDDMFDVIDGYKFQPYTLEYRGFPYLEIGDYITITKMNDDSIAVPIFETKITWDGGLKGTLNASAISKSETKYRYQGRVSNAEIKVNKVSAQIDLKVSKDSIISSINLSPEAIVISSSKINLSGYVTFTNLSTSGQTTINGGNLINNSITTDKLNVTTLSAISANVGTLTAGTIGGWTVNSSTISRSGITLGSDFISLGNTGTSGSTINMGTAKIYNQGGNTIAISGALYAGTSLQVNGQTTSQSIIPVSDSTYSVGTSGFRYLNAYFDNVNGSVTTPSDIKLKKDITQIENGIELILSLNPVQYKYKDGNSGRTHYGFIAQEVKETMTSVGIEDAGVYVDLSVLADENEDKDNLYKGLRYYELIAPMIKTIQNLNERVNVLENERN